MNRGTNHFNRRRKRWSRVKVIITTNIAIEMSYRKAGNNHRY